MSGRWRWQSDSKVTSWPHSTYSLRIQPCQMCAMLLVRFAGHPKLTTAPHLSCAWTFKLVIMWRKISKKGCLPYGVSCAFPRVNISCFSYAFHVCRWTCPNSRVNYWRRWHFNAKWLSFQVILLMASALTCKSLVDSGDFIFFTLKNCRKHAMNTTPLKYQT